MVEAQLLWKLVRRKNGQVNGIIGGFWCAVTDGYINDGDCVEATVAGRIGVATEQVQRVHIKTGFFLCFPNRSVLEGFTIIDETSWQCPALWLIAPIDQYNPGWNLNDDVYGGYRITVGADRRMAIGAVEGSK
jgi:hypothetical protein